MSRLKPTMQEDHQNPLDQTDQTNGMDSSANSSDIVVDDTITETPIEDLPVIDNAEGQDSNELTENDSTEPATITTTVEDCQTMYGVIMETAHAMVGTRNGKGHKELPEERRNAQGKLLHSLCEKYGIEIPTEFELVIFGGSLIADWQYMTIKAEDNNV